MRLDRSGVSRIKKLKKDEFKILKNRMSKNKYYRPALSEKYFDPKS